MQATSRSALRPSRFPISARGALRIAQTQPRRQLGPQDPILSRQVLVP